MKSIKKRRKKFFQYGLVLQDIIDIIKENTIFILIFLIVFIFSIMKGSVGTHLGLFLDVLFIPMVLGSNWGYIFFSSRTNEVGRVWDKESWIALREDESNPLYVKNCFRKNYKKKSRYIMAKLKGYYFCQIIAIIQIIVMIIRSIYIIVVSIELQKKEIYYGVIWPDLVILVWIAINVVLRLAFHTYYSRIIKRVRNKNQRKFIKEKTLCRKCNCNDNYGTFFYKRFTDYSKMFYETEVSFQNKFNGMEYLLFGTAGNMANNLKIDAAEDRVRNNLQILVQMYQRRLKIEHIEMMNQFVPKMVCEASKRTLPLGVPYVTYFIYVEEKTEVFEEIFCGEIYQRKSFFCLPVGVVLKEDKMYIPGMQKGFGYKEYCRMKENIFEILSQRDPNRDSIKLPCGWRRETGKKYTKRI